MEAGGGRAGFLEEAAVQLGLEDLVVEEGVPGGRGPHRDREVGSTAGDPGLVSRCRRPAGGRVQEKRLWGGAGLLAPLSLDLTP